MWNKKSKLIQELEEKLRISDKESMNKIQQLIEKVTEQDKELDEINESYTVYRNTSNEIIIKLKKDLKDIIESDSKLKEKIIYTTIELKSKVIKSISKFTKEEYPHSGNQPLNDLMIELLPYINSIKEINDEEIIVTNQLTILTK